MAERVEYREIPGHPGYRVGSDGTVWSQRQRGRWNRLTDEWRQLKPYFARGYPQVNLDDEHRSIHRLVLEAFVGPCPLGQECRHLDGSRTNNRLENLCWGTRAEQTEDKKAHGTVARGSRINQGKLTESDIPEIFRLRGQGLTLEAIAALKGVAPTTVAHVLKRRSWKHVETP